MGGIVEIVKEKIIGLLSHAFGGAASAGASGYSFGARDVHQLFHGPQRLIPADQLSSRYLLGQASSMKTLMMRSRDPHSIEDGMFLLSYTEFTQALTDWQDYTPLTLREDIILPLYNQISAVPMMVDRLTQKQRKATHPGDIKALQKDIRALEQFNGRLQRFLNVPDIQAKSAKQARQARLEADLSERHPPFPSQWKI